MRIDSASIGMDSARSYFQTESSVRRFTATTKSYIGYEDGAFSDLLNAEHSSAEEKEDTSENISTKGDSVSEALENLSNRINRNTGVATDPMDDIRKQINKLREECINYLLRLLFPDRYCDVKKDINLDTSENSGGIVESGNFTAANVISLSYSNSYYYEESETTAFQAQGIVNCADGRQIDFNMDIIMSRDFCEYYSEEMDFLEVSLKDPLVINLEGSIPSLSDQTFFFDIDCDGVEDEISRLIAGSGFLALDKNDDGAINDGSELFGALTGNGFDELAQYDDDGDGFIDEDDEIFNKLRVWSMDEDGNSRLYTLAEAGVGAIGLRNVATQFSLNSLSTNETYGVIRNTGMFLYENGNVGTVTQLDLAVRNKALAAYA